MIGGNPRVLVKRLGEMVLQIEKGCCLYPSYWRDGGTDHTIDRRSRPLVILKALATLGYFLLVPIFEFQALRGLQNEKEGD